jgi:myo-inositol-1-phosphate synthase
MSKVRLAIVGVGNCASSLVQGLEFYKDAQPQDTVPGLMHVDLGGYHIRDVELVAAFDVDAKKVGKDVAEAIVSSRTTRSGSRTCRTSASMFGGTDARWSRPLLPRDDRGVRRHSGRRDRRVA